MKRVKTLNISYIKQVLTLIFLCVFVSGFYAQTVSKSDTHNSNQNVVIKIDGSQNGWVKGDNETAAGTTTSISGNENVSFNGTSEGIYVTILSGTNKIKLFALTGQLLLDGDLAQGRFFIPTRKGIYFLKVNNKSFKVICR